MQKKSLIKFSCWLFAASLASCQPAHAQAGLAVPTEFAAFGKTLSLSYEVHNSSADPARDFARLQAAAEAQYTALCPGRLKVNLSPMSYFGQWRAALIKSNAAAADWQKFYTVLNTELQNQQKIKKEN